jgi:hypothetical protein
MVVDLHVVAPGTEEALGSLLANCARAGLDGVCLLGAGEAPPVAAARQRAAGTGLALFFGVEFLLDRGRLIWIPRDPEVLGGPWREELGPRPTVDRVTALAAGRGGILLAAHPYDRSAGASFADAIYQLEGIQGIQVANASLNAPRNHLALDAVLRLKLAAVGGTGPGGTPGRAATVLLGTPADQAALVDVLARGDVWALEFLDEAPPPEDPEHDFRRDRDRGPERGGDRGGRPDFRSGHDAPRGGQGGGLRPDGDGRRRHRGRGPRPGGPGGPGGPAGPAAGGAP